MSRRTCLRICSTAISNAPPFLNAFCTLGQLHTPANALLWRHVDTAAPAIAPSRERGHLDSLRGSSVDKASQWLPVECREASGWRLERVVKCEPVLGELHGAFPLLPFPRSLGAAISAAHRSVNSTKMRRKRMMNKHKHRKRLKKNRNKTKR